jgi:hypothetical protein
MHTSIQPELWALVRAKPRSDSPQSLTMRCESTISR